MSSEDKFRAAVNVIRNLPSKGSFQPSTDLQLKFYSYFKQATEGPCSVAKPSFWDVVGKAKWDAWKNLGTMGKEEAMEKYVEELKQVIDKLKETYGNDQEKIVETMSYTESVSEFMELLGPFYEAVPLDKSNSQPHLNTTPENTNGGDGGMAKVNGFGMDGGESDSEEFSDTYDHIKESCGIGGNSCASEVAAAAVIAGGNKAAAASNGGVGVGDNGYGSNEDPETNNNQEGINPPGLIIEEIAKLKEAQKLRNRRDSNNDRNAQNANALREKTNELENVILQARGGAEQKVVPTPNPRSDIGPSAAANRGARSRNTRDSSSTPSSGGGDVSRVGGAAGGSGSGGAGGMQVAWSGDVNEQLALAVIKLQHSLDETNVRLQALEKKLANDRTRMGSGGGVIQKIFGVSPNLLALIVVWPFLALFLVKAAQRNSSNQQSR